jgi:lipopolysaccharide biosynthesis glycosyltransferase
LNPIFFDLKNFIKKQETFDALPAGSTKPWHVAYNVNDPFFQIMGASMVSVLENNLDQPLVFHLFTDGYSRENADKVRQLAEKWHCRCVLYELNMEPFQDFHVKVARFSRITYGRLYMAKVLKSLTDRFLYLDADTMVIRPLTELFQIDMMGKAMGAVSRAAEGCGLSGRVPEAEEREVF